MKPDNDTLHDLYVTQRATYSEIAARFGVTKTTVLRWLRAAGIPARSKTEQRLLAKKTAHSEEALARMRERAANMRKKITADSHAKRGKKLKGRVAPNKGTPWTPEQREKHMAVRATQEYRDNLSASLSGEKNYNWKGGAPSRSPSGWRWRDARDACYSRDNWTCRDCGCKCLNTADSKLHPKRKIQAHHVISRRNGGTDELANLVTLCMSCHHKRERRYADALFA